MMQGTDTHRQKPLRRARRSVAIAVGCAAFAAGMVGAAYASVPLYELFCQVTGYGGTIQRASAPGMQIVDQEVTVRFDANVASGLDWSFQPMQRAVTVKLGEVTQIAYKVKNNADHAVTGRAAFNVTPGAAGVYFNKIECFCFTDQTLQPGEALEMPVLFFVDPDMLETEELKDAPPITLSYTFFAVPGETAPVAAASKSPESPDRDQL